MSNKEKDRDCLISILKYMDKIDRFVADKQSSEELFLSEEKYDATVLNLILIGEKVAKLSPDFKATYPEISWKRIKDFRNYTVHNYDDVDPEIVWEVLQKHLPKLKTNLRQILAQ